MDTKSNKTIFPAESAFLSYLTGEGKQWFSIEDAYAAFPDKSAGAEPLSGGGRYYIGYYSVLQIHGLITQPSLKEQVVREKRKTETVVLKGAEFQFIYHNEKHFFEMAKALWTAREKLDYGKLLSYARQFDSQVAYHRLAALLMESRSIHVNLNFVYHAESRNFVPLCFIENGFCQKIVIILNNEIAVFTFNSPFLHSASLLRG